MTSSQQDVFVYTIKDGDGDLSTTTLTINVANVLDPPAAAGITVDEAALDTVTSGADIGNGTVTGSNPGSTAETVTGTLSVPGATGFVPQNITTTYGLFKLNANGTYTYTLTKPFDTNPDNNNGVTTVNAAETISYTATDGANNVTGTITVNIIDDVPTANADEDFIASGASGPVTGNVLDATEDTVAEDANATDGVADRQGADGAVVVGVAAGNINANLDSPATLGTPIQGLYGKLTILNDGGDYTYTRDPGTAGNASDVFTYTIKDGDGDLAHTTLTIHIGNAPVRIYNFNPALEGGDVTVDEDDLPAGSDTPKQSLTQAGSFNISAPDGVKTLVIGATTVINSAVNNGAFTPATITTPLGNTLNILTYNSTTGLITYSYTLTGAETHANAGSQNSLPESFSIMLTDQDNDSISANLVVQIIDDVPVANDDTANQFPENAPILINVIANDTRGADGVANSAILQIPGSLTGLGTLTNNGNGTFTYVAAPGEAGTVTFQYTISDADGDSDPATVTINLAQDSVPIGGQTAASVDDDGLSGATGTGNPASTIDDLTVPNGDGDGSEATFGGTLVFTPSGDIPNVLSFAGMDGLTGSVGTETVTYGWAAGTNTLTATGPRGILFTVQITNVNTGTYKVTLLDNVLHAGGPNNENAVDPTTALTYTIKDSDSPAVNGTLTITFDDDAPSATAEASQNVAEGATLNGTFDFIPGADGAGVTHIGTTALTFGGDGFSQAVALGSLGSIKVKADGTYQFTAANPVASPQTATGTFTVTDGDGDTVQAGFSFVITDANVPLGGQTAASVDDDGLSGATGTGNPASTIDDLTVPNGDGDGSEATFGGTLVFTPSGDIPNVLSFAGMDGLTGSVGTETVTYGWAAGTNTLTATGPRGILFTVQITNVNTGTYKVTLLDNVLHAGGPNNENAVDPTTALTYTIKDSDSPAVNGTLTITFDDDAPSATAEASQNVAEGATLNGTFDFIPGADGAGVTHIGTTALTFGGDGFSQAVALGSLGSIKVKADGTYQFTAANPVASPQTATGTFTVTDGDGDTVQAGFSFVITDANVPLGGQTAASVDDDGLSGATGTGNPASTIDDLTVPNGDGDGSEATFGGTLVFTPSGDIPNVLSFAGMDGLTGSVGTETVTYGWAAGTNTLTATGPRGILFTVQITNVNTGTYKVTLLDNVLHAGGPNNENAVDPTTALTYTIKDSDSPAVNGTLTITFDDDAPSAVVPTAISLTNAAGAPVLAALDPSLLDNYGADGGTPRFSPTLNGTDSGLTTGGGINPIIYTVSPGGLSLIGKVGVTTVFTITLLPGSNQYSVDMDGTVNSLTTLSFASGIYQFVGGNTAWVGFVPTGQDTTGGAINDSSKDLLITPSIGGVNAGTINGSSVALGVSSGNAVDAGEMVRIDFVKDLLGDTAGPGGYGTAGNRDHVFDSHYVANGASALLTASSVRRSRSLPGTTQTATTWSATGRSIRSPGS